MYQNEKTTLYARNINRRKSEAYINEYQNQAALTNSPSTEDYRKYMTKSLINRGFLFNNLDNVERIYKASIQELFSKEFKNIFLYAADRDITDIYKSIDNVKNMGPIGIFDLFSSLITGINAKYLPTFETFEFEPPTNEDVVKTLDYEEKIQIISDRENVTKEFKHLYHYIRLTDDEILEGPIEGEDYFVVSTKYTEQISLYENVTEGLTEFDLDTTYYKRESIETQKEILLSQTKYDKENDVEFEEPIQIYNYILNDLVIPNDIDISLLDFSSTELAESIEIVYNIDNETFTDEEILPFIKMNVTKKIDETFIYYMKDCLISLKEIFSKYDIYKIISSIEFENTDSYVISVVKITYCKFLNAFAALVYGICASNYLNDNSVIKNIINGHITNTLSTVHILKEMFSTKDYFSPKVIEPLLSDYLKEYLHLRYTISSPLSDEIDYKEINTTVDKITCILTENIIKLRTMIENTNFVDTVDYSNLFCIFLTSFVVFIQIFYNSAYISQHKTPVVKSVREIFQHFGIIYDKVITSKELSNFITIFKKEND